MSKHLSATTGPQRLAYGTAAGLLMAVAAYAAGLRGMPMALLGWCGGVAAYLGLAWWLAHSFDSAQVRQRARSLDQPGMLIFAILLVVAATSVIAIAMLLQQVKQLNGLERFAHIVLGLVALAGSWLMIHTIFAFHYAHSFYQDDDTPNVGGLEFPGTEAPDYADFMYYSFVIGMTSQTSDVDVTTRGMRRTTLIQSVLAFGFNMLVLALSINVVAGAL